MSAYSVSAHGLAMRKVPQGVLDTVNQLLFDAGQVGGNLPFSDFSKIWQDSAGTTPYTAVEQYAGLLLNKAVPQVSNGTARVNIIADSTNFASTASCVITNNKFVATAASGYHNYATSIMAPGAVYKIKLKVKAAEYTKLYIADLYNGNFAVAVDLVALTYSGVKRTATNISVTSLGSGIVEVQLTATDYAGAASVVGVVGYPSTGATLDFWGAQYTGDGVSGLYVYAVDVRLLSDEAVLPAYQRIDNNVWVVPYSPGCFYQATSAARPVVSARVNLFQKSQADAAWVGAGSTPPVVANNVSYLGESCGATTFTPGSNLGYAGSRSGCIGVGGTIGNIIAGTAYSAKFNVSLSRPLTGSEAITLFCTGSSGLGSITINVANSSAFVGKFAEAKSVKATAAVSGIASPYSYLTTGVSSDIVVYINKCSLFAENAQNLPYQRVNTPTDYDTAGFPNYAKFDGIDDNFVSETGGGGTAGIYYCGAIQFNKVGAVQTIFSDTGTNSGYKLQLTAANQLQISAGNGTAFTAINTTGVFALGDVSLCELWDDGTNLGVRLGEGTPVTVARPVVTAGTAQITIGKDNNAASSYAGINMFEPVWRYGAMPNAPQREAIRAICRAKARIV